MGGRGGKSGLRTEPVMGGGGPLPVTANIKMQVTNVQLNDFSCPPEANKIFKLGKWKSSTRK